MLEWIQAMDVQVLTNLRETFCAPASDKLMLFVSALGDAGFLWVAVGLLFLMWGNKKQPWRSWGLRILLCLGATALVCNLILKPAVARIRPYDLLGFEVLVAHLSDFSFPSGHTAASFAAATAIYSINKKWGIAAYFFAALMGFSRLYLGVHFPTDVLAGAAIGICVSQGVLFAMRNMQAKKQKM